MNEIHGGTVIAMAITELVIGDAKILKLISLAIKENFFARKWIKLNV